jgi:hypothetical protein
VTTVDVQDVNGNRVTSSTATITATADSGTCTGAGGGDVAPVTQTASASAGRATFTFTSNGSYSGCTITYTSTGLTSATSTEVWTAGGADHLSCAFSPKYIVSDGSSTSTATVRVRDQLGNSVSSGSYSVTFSQTGHVGTPAGSSTTLITSSPQTTTNGSTSFTVRSVSGANGTDTFSPTITSGSSPTLPLVVANGTCSVTAQPTIP